MKKYLNRKVISLTTTVLLIMLAVAGTTFAYYSDATASVSNSVTVGSIETEIVEQVDSVGNKNVTIKNVGKSECYIRARITKSPENAPVEIVGLNGTDWILGADGFYYYQQKVSPIAPGNLTTPLFTGYQITNADNFVPFEITIYQEAVQAAVYDEDNNQHVYTVNEAWEVYDNGTN